MAGPHSIELLTAAVPSTQAITLTTKDEVYEVTLPRECGGVVVTPAANALLGYTVSADITDTSHPIPASSVSEWPVFLPRDSKSGGGRICLQGSATPTKVSLTLLPRAGLLPE